VKYRVFGSSENAYGHFISVNEIECTELTEIEKKALLQDLKDIQEKETQDIKERNKEAESWNTGQSDTRVIQGHEVKVKRFEEAILDEPVFTITEKPNRIIAIIKTDARSKAAERIIEQLAELGWK